MGVNVAKIKRHFELKNGICEYILYNTGIEVYNDQDLEKYLNAFLSAVLKRKDGDTYEQD